MTLLLLVLWGVAGGARSIFVNLGVICVVSKLYKTENCTKEKNIGCVRGGVHGEGGNGEGKALFLNYTKKKQHWFCWGSHLGGEGAGVNVQSSWRGRRASPALDPNSGVGG